MSSTEVVQNLRKFHTALVDNVLDLCYTKNALGAAQEGSYSYELLHFISNRPKAAFDFRLAKDEACFRSNYHKRGVTTWLKRLLCFSLR